MAHAVVVTIDAKSQLPALDRFRPDLPLKPGECGMMTDRYHRHGTADIVG